MVNQMQMRRPLMMPPQTGGFNPQGLPPRFGGQQGDGVKKLTISNFWIVIFILIFLGILALVWFWDYIF